MQGIPFVKHPAGLTPHSAGLLANEDYADFKAFRAQTVRGRLPDLASAIDASTVTALNGLPYPVHFRNRGALDEWRLRFNFSRWGQGVWSIWAEPDSTCLDCIHEVHWQLEQYLGPCPRYRDPADRADTTLANSIQWAVNLHYERKYGALIETTQALDTLLLHSDLDDSLPMRLFSPPFPAQYLRLDRAVAAQFQTEDDRAHRRWVDGIFCFLTTMPAPEEPSGVATILELVIVYNTNDVGVGTHMLRAPIRSAEQSVIEWVSAIFLAHNGKHTADDDALARLVNYMVKVFLYLGLKDARREIGTEYSAAVKRMTALGPKKQAKAQRRLASLYDRITVGPASLSAAPVTQDDAAPRSPHWRRGHFRLQPCGPAWGDRKLIFVAPILIRADRLSDGMPRPKTYALSAGRVRT